MIIIIRDRVVVPPSRHVTCQCKGGLADGNTGKGGLAEWVRAWRTATLWLAIRQAQGTLTCTRTYIPNVYIYMWVGLYLLGNYSVCVYHREPMAAAPTWQNKCHYPPCTATFSTPDGINNCFIESPFELSRPIYRCT